MLVATLSPLRKKSTVGSGDLIRPPLPPWPPRNNGIRRASRRTRYTSGGGTFVRYANHEVEAAAAAEATAEAAHTLPRPGHTFIHISPPKPRPPPWARSAPSGTTPIWHNLGQIRIRSLTGGAGDGHAARAGAVPPHCEVEPAARHSADVRARAAPGMGGSTCASTTYWRT